MPIARVTRTTWRTDTREIAKALGIPVGPGQWVTLESGSDDTPALLEHVDVVVWHSHPPAEFNVPEMIATAREVSP